MWKNSFKCNFCDRPMPPNVYGAHLKKRHSEEGVANQVEKNDKELGELIPILSANLETGETESFVTPKEYHGLTNPPYKLPFDWGEVYPCSSCGEEYPAKAMPFHSWVRHRV